MAGGWLPGLQLAAQAAIYLGFSLVLGTAASEAWARAALSSWRAGAAAQALRLRRIALPATAVAMLLSLWVQAAVMGEVALDQAADTLVVLLRETHFGHVAVVGLAAWALAAWAGWRTWPGHPLRIALLAAALAVALWSRSAVSHAADHGDWSWDVLADGIHLLAACLWVGIVIVAAMLQQPSADSPSPDRAAATAWVSSLSSTATAALAVVVATGALKVWRVVPDWPGLFASAYGARLGAKLLLVAAAAALGGVNRLRVLPALFAALAQPATAAAVTTWRGRLRLVLRIEALVLVLVLVTAALLASSEPPSSPLMQSAMLWVR